MRARALAVNAALVALSALTLFPLFWMASVSLMAPGEASRFPPPLLPAEPTLAHYRELLGDGGILRQALNTMGLAVAATVLSLTFNVAAGYAFAKLRFPGRDRLFRTLLGALVIPAQVTMMPLFLMLKSMGLVNTYTGALLPWIAGVFGIFLVRQYALSIPDELLEAARIDGAGLHRSFLQIMVPLARPALATLCIFNFLWAWNEFLYALLLLTSDNVKTLTVGVLQLQGRFTTDYPALMAGLLITSLPVVGVYLLFQRHLVRAIVAGAVK